MTDAHELISFLNLKPLPQEGGHYRETYRAEGKIGSRCYSTAILYLLKKGEKSLFHKIRSDEVWHFYSGGPLVVVELYANEVKQTLLGSDLFAGQTLQHVVPGGTWFGSFPAPQTEYSLVGCTVAPNLLILKSEIGRA
jgi:uncharacterized protein